MATAVETGADLGIRIDELQSTNSIEGFSGWVKDKKGCILEALASGVGQFRSAIYQAPSYIWAGLPTEQTLGTFSDWIGDKGKYFIETLTNATDYLRLAPTLRGGKESDSWGPANASLKSIKNVMALPSVFKGSYTFYQNIQKGTQSVRNLAGDLCSVVGDTIDTIQGGLALAGSALPKSVKVLGKDMPIASSVQVLKNITGLYGLVNTSYNLTVDMGRLRQVNLAKDLPKGVDAQDAARLKKEIIEAEINNKWYDRLRCSSAAAMCALGLIGMVGLTISPWAFAILGTVGACGKYHMYAAKAQGEIYQTQYAALLPERVQKLKSN